MALCSLAAWWHHAKLIHDWHNFGYTLMALSLGRRHWLVSTNWRGTRHGFAFQLRSLRQLSSRALLMVLTVMIFSD